jgi:GNAT superfamily N-acetyltransferase
MRLFRSMPRVVPAPATEAALLADLYHRAWLGCEHVLDPRLVADQRPSATDVSAWFLGGFEIFRVRHDGHVVGAVRCCFPASTCLVDRLAVDPDVRGRGVGQQLLQHAIGRARRAGVTRVWAQVSPKLGYTQALFRSLGFRDAGQVCAAYWDEDVVLLERPV